MSSASVTPVAELHRQEVDALLDAELVDRNDVGVRELDRGLRFGDEALDEGFVGRELGADLFDDELLLEAACAAQGRQENARHAAHGDAALEDVFAEDLRKQGESPRPQVYTFATRWASSTTAADSLCQDRSSEPPLTSLKLTEQAEHLLR